MNINIDIDSKVGAQRIEHCQERFKERYGRDITELQIRSIQDLISRGCVLAQQIVYNGTQKKKNVAFRIGKELMAVMIVDEKIRTFLPQSVAQQIIVGALFRKNGHYADGREY